MEQMWRWKTVKKKESLIERKLAETEGKEEGGRKNKLGNEIKRKKPWKYGVSTRVTLFITRLLALEIRSISQTLL